jgi:hypothetical protein
MAYGSYGGGYQNNKQGNSYGNNNQGYNNGNGGGNQYSKTPYTPPQKKEFILEDEASKYGLVYLTLVEQLKATGVPIEEVKDFLGGWTTSLKLSLDKS